MILPAEPMREPNPRKKLLVVGAIVVGIVVVGALLFALLRDDSKATAPTRVPSTGRSSTTDSTASTTTTPASPTRGQPYVPKPLPPEASIFETPNACSYIPGAKMLFDTGTITNVTPAARPFMVTVVWTRDGIELDRASSQQTLRPAETQPWIISKPTDQKLPEVVTCSIEVA